MVSPDPDAPASEIAAMAEGIMLEGIRFPGGDEGEQDRKNR